jgi:hypothetical protein
MWQWASALPQGSGKPHGASPIDTVPIKGMRV